MEAIDRLLDQLTQLQDGELCVLSRSGRWRFYVLDGRLLYVSGESLAVRRFQRAARFYRPNWQWVVDPAWPAEKQSWEIPLIESAIAHDKLSSIQVKLILRAVLQECLFELRSDPNARSEWHPYHLEASAAYRSAALSITEVQRIWNKTKILYQTWQEGRLGYLSLNVSPIVSEGVSPDLLLVPRHYLEGNSDLWDISQNVEPSLAQLGNLLLPLIEAQAIRFENFPDLPIPIQPRLAGRQALPSQPLDAMVSASSGSVSSGSASSGSASSDLGSASPQKLTHSALIACIDDSPVLTQSLKKMLTSAGYRTLSIPEPMRGFATLIEHLPDLILLDLMLPNADGYSICKFLRETPVFENTPIIILTGQDSNLDRLRARLAGATEFLSKPPKLEPLLNVIQANLNLSRDRSA